MALGSNAVTMQLSTKYTVPKQIYTYSTTILVSKALVQIFADICVDYRAPSDFITQMNTTLLVNIDAWVVNFSIKTHAPASCLFELKFKSSASRLYQAT